ncbi:MAG: pilus assembly protein TadG-related protein [Solirubrobacteraceae bacterium]
MSSLHRGESRRRLLGLWRGALACAAGRIRTEESGVVIILVAGMLIMVLGMGALAIDLGSFYKAQRQAQAAADAGALAASQDLPNSAGNATSDGQKYATANYPSANATVVTPYNGSTSQVQVTVNAKSPAILGGLFGVTAANITATAVAAGGGNSSAPTAVFAASTDCGDKGVSVNGSGIVVGGGTHSNGVIRANGSGDNLGTTTYGGPKGCGLNVNGSNMSFGGGTPTRDAIAEPWPRDYSKLTYPAPDCTPGQNTFIAASFSWTTGGTIPPGVYCATTGDITLSGANLDASGCTFVAQQGRITLNGSGITTSGNFFAPGTNGSINLNGSGITLNGVFEATSSNGQININGSGVTGNAVLLGAALALNGSGISIAPYPGYQNLTAYQTGTQSLTVNGSGYLSGGAIFAPNAAIALNGSGNSTGMLEGQDVTLNGSNYTITGNGPPVAGTFSGATLIG